MKVLVSKENCHARFNQMCWPVPGQRLAEVDYKLRYNRDSLSVEDLLLAASILSAYDKLIRYKTQKQRNKICEVLKKVNWYKSDEPTPQKGHVDE